MPGTGKAKLTAEAPTAKGAEGHSCPGGVPYPSITLSDEEARGRTRPLPPI
jgi:hypothetical protein